MSLLFKIFIFWLTFTSCEKQEQGEVDKGSTSALSKQLEKSRWSSQSVFPAQIKYGNSFDATEITAIENSANSWSSSVDNQITFFDVQPSNIENKNNLDLYDDSELGIYKLTQWPTELPQTALAVTQIFGSSMKSTSGDYIKIDHADILINYDSFSFSTDDSWGYDLETVILHEMGHFLGL